MDCNCGKDLLISRQQNSRCCSYPPTHNSIKPSRRHFNVCSNTSQYYCCSLFILLLLTSASVVVNAGDHDHSSNNSSSSQIRTVIVNAGENVSLVCAGNRSNESVFWIHETKDSERIISGYFIIIFLQTFRVRVIFLVVVEVYKFRH